MNINTFLLAISLVESGGRDFAVGACGERSRYQMTAATWRQHSKTSFASYAHNKDIAHAVACAHVIWLQEHAPSGWRDSPEHLALCWRYGLTGARRVVKHGGPPDDYAERVATLYYAIETNRRKE